MQERRLVRYRESVHEHEKICRYADERIAYKSSEQSHWLLCVPSQKIASPQHYFTDEERQDGDDYEDEYYQDEYDDQNDDDDNDRYVSFKEMEEFRQARDGLMQERTPSMSLQKYDSERSAASIDQSQRLRQRAKILDPIAWLDIMDIILVPGFLNFNYESICGAPQPLADADNVVVRVVATTVNAKPEYEATCTISKIEDDTKSSFFVGAIERYDSRYSKEHRFEIGSLVTSMERCHTRARFVDVKAESLVLLPEMFDVGEAVTVVSTFLPAFGALHHGASTQSKRYSTNCFKGQRVFVVGGSWAEARAVAKLALLGGAKQIYMLLSGTFMVYNDQDERVLASGATPDDWLPRLRNRVDILIDSGFPMYFDSLQATLKRSGRHVCRSPTTPSADSQGCRSLWCGDLEDIWQQTTLCMAHNSSIFNFDSMDPVTAEFVEQDLCHLYQLLAQQQLRPKIEKYVRLHEVEAAQKLIHSQVSLGSVICEPWRS